MWQPGYSLEHAEPSMHHGSGGEETQLFTLTLANSFQPLSEMCECTERSGGVGTEGTEAGVRKDLAVVRTVPKPKGVGTDGTEAGVREDLAVVRTVPKLEWE